MTWTLSSTVCVYPHQILHVFYTPFCIPGEVESMTIQLLSAELEKKEIQSRLSHMLSMRSA